jgi:glycosyltransferase involved in cell wall biosynthesis
MRIALVTRRFPPLIGGAEAMLRYLAAALADAGAEVTVLTSRLEGLPAEDRVETPGGGRFRVVRLETSPLRFVGTWLYMRNLRRWLETNPIDVAYVSMLKHDAYVALGVSRGHSAFRSPSPLAGEGRGGGGPSQQVGTDTPAKPGVVASPHPNPPPQGGRESEGALLLGTRGRTDEDIRRGFAVVLRPEGAGGTGDIAWQSWGRGGRAIARRCKAADAFVAISSAVRTELVSAGYDEARIANLPNGVPLPEEGWAPRSDRLRSPHAVYVGRLATEKGLQSLIDAWPAVQKTFLYARLTLIGEGPERPAIEARIARLGLGDVIKLPGASPDPGSVLRDSDLFVLPSREEGMSIALLEAMAMGIPIVASAIPGNLKLVDDGVHGRLAHPGDPDDLARAIVAQWSDPEAAAWMGLEARRRVQDRYSIAAVAQAHLELFRRLHPPRSVER